MTSSDAIKGYFISGVTAGLTAGLFDGWTGTETVNATGKIVTVPGALGTWAGVGQFAANQVLQNTTSTLLGKALGQGGDLGDALKGALFNTLAAASFNAIGDYTQGVLTEGYPPKVIVHAMVGGLLSKATGGDFKTGALAAGINEALVVQLDTLVKGDKDLLSMSSQIVGVLAAASQKDADAKSMEQGGWVAKNATQYNFLGGHSSSERDKARNAFAKDQRIDSAKTLITLEGADQRSDNLLAAYKNDPGSLSAAEVAELTAYLQVYTYEQVAAKGETQARAELANLLEKGPVPSSDFYYAGTSDAKNAYADAARAELSWGEQFFWTRDKSANELVYRDAEGILRINNEQQGLANIGSPAIYGLSGPLGASVRIAAAANGVLQAGQGAKQAFNGDGWNAAGNLLAGALAIAGLGFPGSKPSVAVGAKATGGAAGKVDDLAASGLSSASSLPSGTGLGGFKVGLSADDITAINSQFGGSVSFREVDTAIANAANYDGFYNKAGSMIRDIAGGHLFDNGNKRTAVEVVEQLIIKNGVDGPPKQIIWNVVDKVATGKLTNVQDISKALRGLD
ncbi:DUF637 domain-containing protein [Pseudomonas poae]|nr:DUF637 domain-containing protein [Pseudomonas poae]AGE25740.1 putative adhesin [Pseudomonas poae RE*1-1-14]MCF5779930.1 hypothetical protein [Pseudomonas poae]